MTPATNFSAEQKVIQSTTPQMALAIEYVDGRVRYIEGETAEPWMDVLERAGEVVAEGMIVTVKRVAKNPHDMPADVYMIRAEEDQVGEPVPIKWTEYYLVGSLVGPTEPDADDEVEAQMDRDADAAAFDADAAHDGRWDR